jgi:hypothetical protein
MMGNRTLHVFSGSSLADSRLTTADCPYRCVSTRQGLGNAADGTTVNGRPSRTTEPPRVTHREPVQDDDRAPQCRVGVCSHPS